MNSWKSTRTSKEPCVAGDGLYLEEFANVNERQSRQKSGGPMTPPGSVGTLESNGVEGLWQSGQARMSLTVSNKAPVSTPPLSVQQPRSYHPPTSQAKRNIPTFEDLDLPLDNDPWFPEGHQHISQMTIQRGATVERGMLFPWMTDSEIV